MSELLDPVTHDEGASALRKLATLALLAVALGFVIQILVLGAKLAAGGPFPGVAFAADIAGGVAWSSVVCLGAGVGTALIRAQAAVASAIAAVFAPVAVAASKAANQIVSAAIGAVDKPGAVSLVGLAATKAIEYAILGFALATLARAGQNRVVPYLSVGAGVGLPFAAIALGLRWGTAPTPALVGTAVNEVFFPIGCAAVVYAGVIAGASRASTTAP